MEGDLTEEIKVALSEEERLARASTKSSRISWWTQSKFEMSEIMHLCHRMLLNNMVNVALKHHTMARNNAFPSIVCFSRPGTCSENKWTLNVVEVEYLTICS